MSCISRSRHSITAPYEANVDIWHENCVHDELVCGEGHGAFKVNIVHAPDTISELVKQARMLRPNDLESAAALEACKQQRRVNFRTLVEEPACHSANRTCASGRRGRPRCITPATYAKKNKCIPESGPGTYYGPFTHTTPPSSIYGRLGAAGSAEVNQ